MGISLQSGKLAAVMSKLKRVVARCWRKVSPLVRNVEIVSWLVIVALLLVAGSYTLATQTSSKDASSDDLQRNAFAFGVAEVDLTKDIDLAGSPTIDLAPTPSGLVHGQIRIPFLKVPHFETREPFFTFALPRSTEFDVSLFIQFETNNANPVGLSPSKWRCSRASDYLSGDLVALKKLYNDAIRISCRNENMALVTFFPPGGLTAEQQDAQAYGTFTRVDWAKTLDFEIPNYPGIVKQQDGQSNYGIFVDPLMLKNEPGRPYDALPSGVRPIVSVTPWNDAMSLTPASIPVQSLPHYAEFGIGNSNLFPLESSNKPLFLSGVIANVDQGVVSNLVGNTYFVFFLGLLAGQFQGAIKWLLKRMRPWRDSVPAAGP